MSVYKGLVALVTGASTGIGAAIAKTLVKEGLVVVGAAPQVEQIQALSESLKGEPGRLVAERLDVSKPNEIKDIFKKIENEFGGVTVLVNNAAVGYTKPINEHTTEEIEYVTYVNQIGVLLATKEAVNGIMRQKVDNGYIININSICGHNVPYFKGMSMGLYPTTKFAMTGTCQQLRNDFKNSGLKIRVTNISPGLVATNLTANVKEGLIPPDMLTPDEVARTVSFVLRMPESAEITEITIRPTNEVI